MDYEIVNLNKKVLTVIEPIRLSNVDTDITKKIEYIWQDFFEKCREVEDRITNKPICTYSNYESDEKGKYDINIGYEVANNFNIKSCWFKKIIPSGKYKKFKVKGNVTKENPNFWKNLWEMNLPRKFECDFEEYQNIDMLNAKVNIYISIN